MRLIIFLSLLPLFSMLYHPNQAQELRLSINKIYASEQEAFVGVGLGYNYYRYSQKEAQNSAIRFNLYRPSEQEATLIGILSENQEIAISDKAILKSSLVKSWEADANQDNWRNTNISVGQLNTGIYVVEALFQSQIARVPLLISDQALITKKKGNEIIGFVADMANGRKNSNFEVFILKDGELLAASEKENNLSVFDVDSEAYGRNYKLIAKHEDEFTASDFYYYSYRDDSGPMGLIFTDRPAYRPGQQMYFQGYIRKSKGYAMKAYSDSINITIYDEQRNEVYSKKLKCDANGSFNDSLTIKESAPLGTYSIYADLDKIQFFGYYAEEITGTFRVEEYKKPEYEVQVSLDKEQYISGDTIVADVQADYFFGAPVKNAMVNYRIIREAYHVPWYASLAYSWWYEDWYFPNNYDNGEVIKMENTELDDSGHFQINFATDGETNKSYRYKIIAEVTDASRRTITGNASALATATEFTLSVNAEKFYYKTDEEVVVRIQAADFANEPIETDLEFYVRAYRYDTEEIPSPNVKEIAKTNEKGLAILRFKLDEPGYYQLEATAIDKNGKTVKANNSVYILKEGQSAYSWWNNESAEIQLFTDKKLYHTGDTLKAMILAPDASDALLTLDGKAIVHKNIVRFNTSGENTFKEYEIPLKAGIFGDLQLDIAYVRNGKTYTRGEKITVIPSEKYLNVSISFDEETYKPGNTAEAKISVTDADNNPVPNAQVALSTADESIYFLYPDKTTDIRKSFYPNERIQTYTYINNYSQDEKGKWPAYDYLKSLIEGGKFKPEVDFFVPSGQSHYINLGNFDKDKQLVRGYVVDEATGELLKGVKVHSGDAKVKTNEWGYYELINPTDTVIEFSFKRNKITFKEAGLFREVNSGFRQVNLNIKLNLQKKKQLELTLLNEYLYSPRNSQLMMQTSAAVEDAGAGDWGAEADIGASNMMLQRKSTNARERSEVQPVVRENFKDAIYWNPNIVTDANGEATVKITLPDNLTTWRTTARVITEDTKVGQTFAKVVVKKDLLLRMETPRFFRTGDKMLIATTIHNYLSKRKRVRVNLKANGITVKGTNKYLSIPANGEERVDWEVQANWPGNALLTAEAVTNEESDAKKVSVPVQANGLEVITAESTVLRSEKQSTVEIFIPEEVDLNTVELDLSTSPSVAAALLGSLDQLIGYPYGCVEQTMSRFLPTLIVANTLKELGQSYTSTISETELKKMTDKGLTRLAELQHSDGGWGWWENDDTHPFMTAYVVNGLSLAKETDYKIPENLLEGGKKALRSMLKNQEKPEATTYAYQVASALKADIKDVWENIQIPEADSLDAYQTALWLQAAQLAGDKAMAKNFLSRLELLANKDGDLNYWGGKKFYYSWQDDRVETTAQVVKALAEQDVQHPLISGAVQWLMQKRRGNGWHNTRQTAFTVLGLQKVISSEINPDYDLSVIANGKKVFEGKVESKDVFEKASTITLKSENFTASTKTKYQAPTGVLKHGKNTITLNKQGEGTLYANATLTYFLQKDSESISKIKDKGITVERDYLALKPVFDEDGKVIYKKTPIEETSLTSGTDVLVKVKINSKEDLEYVLIEDPIPAGFEFIRDKSGYLIEGEEAYSGGNYYRSYFRWMNQAHTEYRDNRYAIVLTRLNSGEYEYSYIMKAQIPGTFEVNPAVVQLMYYPEKRGFSDFEEIEVEEKE